MSLSHTPDVDDIGMRLWTPEMKIPGLTSALRPTRLTDESDRVVLWESSSTVQVGTGEEHHSLLQKWLPRETALVP